MFNRRNKLSFGSQISGVLWPAAGFRRAGRYLLHRLSRLPGTPYALAGGFACGAAASFTPFVGLHFILAALIAWVTRANILASAIGTAVGNPWTLPFIWIWIHSLGNWMGVSSSGFNVTELNFPHLFGQLAEALLNGNFSSVIDIAGPVLWPMFVGGIPTAIMVWILSYFPLRGIVESYQQRRIERRRCKETPPLGDI